MRRVNLCKWLNKGTKTYTTMTKKRLKWGAVPLLAAMLVTGCAKETIPPGLRIVKESMMRGAKSLIDPADPTSNSWVEGESVKIEPGSEWGIVRWEDGNFYLGQTVEDEGGGSHMDYFIPNCDFTAAYPASAEVEINLNHVFFKNGSFGQHSFYDDGKVDVKFPMVAYGELYAESLVFRHVTGALVVTMENTSDSNFVLYSVELQAFKNGSEYDLYPDLPEESLSCYPDGDNLIVECDGTSNSWTYYMNDYEGNSPASGIPVIAPGETLRVYLPVPPTEHTDFKLVLHRATKRFSTDVNYNDWGRNYCSRRITDVSVQRNQMLVLPTVQVQ